MSYVEHVGGEQSRIENVKKVRQVADKMRLEHAESTEKKADVLELSPRSDGLQGIVESIANLPDTTPERVERVAQLKQQIQSGTYVIDDQKLTAIAQKLMKGDQLGLGIFN